MPLLLGMHACVSLASPFISGDPCWYQGKCHLHLLALAFHKKRGNSFLANGLEVGCSCTLAADMGTSTSTGKAHSRTRSWVTHGNNRSVLGDKAPVPACQESLLESYLWLRSTKEQFVPLAMILPTYLALPATTYEPLEQNSKPRHQYVLLPGDRLPSRCLPRSSPAL